MGKWRCALPGPVRAEPQVGIEGYWELEEIPITVEPANEDMREELLLLAGC